jgi:hypothetical protein
MKTKSVAEKNGACSRAAWDDLVPAAKGTSKSKASKPAAAAATKRTSAPRAYFFKGSLVYKCGQCSACQNPERAKSKCQDQAGRSAALEKLLREEKLQLEAKLQRAERVAQRAERASKREKVPAAVAGGSGAGGSQRQRQGKAASGSARPSASLHPASQDAEPTDVSDEEESEDEDAAQRKVEAKPTTNGGKRTGKFHFPLKGGALKCCECARWHCVPEEVMNTVCSSPLVGLFTHARRWHLPGFEASRRGESGETGSQSPICRDATWLVGHALREGDVMRDVNKYP